ncbi:mannitol-1-phosphate 5-dehydrogenase [Enterococcus sp. 10A9_DIV0425]|uniref:Mannitol-1-phosphate 5-dehydrogenase n=1 Tax=Candidatus Enterococcus wittei TaxID=1987383 RepID=A0A242JYQ1_9ENTE|nr:mannitol-1-phosphate 5-dehydrogenase [Enterococcus sp. 10A9_DIV0425]OTP10249.1 mannitol-1-phosphate 5-dehydrogenase [Enterococcus sp. 10A9_DIV0425]
MRAVHFGAGNIGRGFIGEVLAANGFEITFVDVNKQVIDALNECGSYTIELADETKEQLTVENVRGLNNQEEPDQVIQAIAKADIVTTAIGPNILPLIAELIAKGIQQREKDNNQNPLDIIACENMIGGSEYLKSEVYQYLTDPTFADQWVGFPNAAVDRIVPLQQHSDPLFVQVEPFKEWVIDETQRKNKEVTLEGVLYVKDLEPYIERKLFSVNTGHATVAYTGALLGYKTIDEAMQDSLVVAQLKSVLQETGSLLVAKWGFDAKKHEAYIDKIIHRFQNKYISDAITRVARTPLRKLGYQERFTRPVRELQEHNLTCSHLTATIGIIFNYYDPEDEQSRQLQEMKVHENMDQLIQEVTGLNDPITIGNIKQNVVRYAKQVA